MKAGEQLTAMEMMAVDPIKVVVAPRMWAGIIAMPILAAIFSAVGIFGGYVVGVLMIGVDAGAFWSQMQGGVDVWRDVGNGVVKSIVFGFAVTFIALFQGYEAKPTPEGVSRATTKTVVYASLAVLGLDFLLTALMFSYPAALRLNGRPRSAGVVQGADLHTRSATRFFGIDDEKDCSRLLGRPLRGAGFRGAAVSRAEGRQHEFAVVPADLRGRS